MKKFLENARITPEILNAIATSTDCHSEQSGPKPNDVEGPAVAAEANLVTRVQSSAGQTLAQLLKRPEITIGQLAPVLRQAAPEFFARNTDAASEPGMHSKMSSEVRNELKSVETEIKYEGYLLQQQKSMERLKKSEQRAIPEWFDYRSVSGLSREMQEKLTRVQPRTLGHASRIPGVTPAAVSLVNVYIEIQGRRREQAASL
jgi:tRNA uridine 5-carboxymethylaminomethyl modification enzyme